MRLGCSTSSLIIPCSLPVPDGVYSLFDSIPRSASIFFGHTVLPICSSHIYSSVNLQPLLLLETIGINILSQGPAFGIAQAIAHLQQLIPASGRLPSDKGTCLTSEAIHLLWACTHAALVFSSKLHFAESRYEEKGCI